MANPELIEYAKNQLKAGSSANYIRTVLIKQGWGERDVNDAIGIAQAEAGSPSGAAAAAKPAESKPAPGKNKFLAIAGLLTGIFLVITGGIAILTLLNIDATLIAMEAAIGTVGLLTGAFSTQILLGWPITIIGLIAGILWIIAGVKELIK